MSVFNPVVAGLLIASVDSNALAGLAASAETPSANSFDRYDADNDGVLSGSEMNSFLQRTGQSASFWDANGSGDITEAEFTTDLQVRSSVQGHASGNNWHKSDFHAIDANHDGIMTKDEWKKFGLDGNLFTANSGGASTMTEEQWDTLIEKINDQKAAAASSGGKK